MSRKIFEVFDVRVVNKEFPHDGKKRVGEEGRVVLMPEMREGFHSAIERLFRYMPHNTNARITVEYDDEGKL